MSYLINYLKLLLLGLIIILGTNYISPNLSILLTIVTVVVLAITIVLDLHKFYSNKGIKWKLKRTYQAGNSSYWQLTV